MSQPEVPQPRESLQEQNRGKIEELRKYGNDLVYVARVLNGVVEEIAQEQGLTKRIHFKTGLEEEKVIGGRFTYKTEKAGSHSRAELGILMPSKTHGTPTVVIETYFTAYDHENVVSAHDPRKWFIDELDEPEKMEQFKRTAKHSFAEAIKKTREAKILIASTKPLRHS